jgi:large subunit ribosomal protein L21
MQQHILPEVEEAIRARAYQFWLEEGRPHGRADIHWQRALASLTEQPAAANITPLMASPKVAPKVATVSDVSLIGGIGPKIKVQLAEARIASLTDIAALSDAALAKLDGKLGLKGRSAREEWTAQAKELLAGKAPRAKADQAKAKKR